MEDSQLKIFIDGSAITNPGSLVGCAGIIVYPTSLGLENRELRWGYSAGTSGSMELLALVNALKWLNKNAQYLTDNEIGSVLILSDSEYVVDAATSHVYRWADPWNKNKWKKVDGGTVKHQSLWKDYLRERKKSRLVISIEWFKGKSTVETKGVDKAAKKAARSIVKAPNFNQLPYKQGSSLLGKNSSLSLFDGAEEISLIRVYSHSMVSRRPGSEYEVRFEVIKDDVIEGRFKAFTTQEIGFDNIDRGNYYYATFTKRIDLPWIEGVEKLGEADAVAIKEKVKLILGKVG